MKFEEAIGYMESLQGYGIVPGLGNIERLCEQLGNPQNSLRFVHIAGTNGKGSVAAYVSTVLKTAGYRVGRYISPVIFDYCERIQVNGRNITRKDLCSYVERMKEVCDRIVLEGHPHPTPFEVETAMSFLYFREKKCDVVVLETGMGGKLDATNIIPCPLVAVITSVSMDHMKFLGNSLESIAENKAGIIKRGCEVVSAVQKEEVMKVIERTAMSLQCPLTVADDKKAGQVKYSLKGTAMVYGEGPAYTLPMCGLYQVRNAVVAVETVRALQRKDFAITEKQLRKGIENTVWPARFQVIGEKPYFIADGAHNPDGAEKLAESLRYYFTNKRIIYIMGVLRDKDYEQIIARTAPLADQIITLTPPDNARALHSLDLARAVRDYHPNVTTADSVEEAVELSLLLADRKDVIVAFGSLSFMGKLIRCVENKTGSGKKANGKQRKN